MTLLPLPYSTRTCPYANPPPDGVPIVVEDADLSTRQVVLWQLRDGVEQFRAGRIVEVLGRDRLLAQAQPARDLGDHVGKRWLAVEDLKARGGLFGGGLAVGALACRRCAVLCPSLCAGVDSC